MDLMDNIDLFVWANDLYSMTEAERKEVERRRNWSQTNGKVTIFFELFFNKKLVATRLGTEILGSVTYKLKQCQQ